MQHFNKLAPLALAIATGLSANVYAGERVVIHVDNAEKASLIQQVKQDGGVVRVDADGFIAVEYKNKKLTDVSAQMAVKNPRLKVEADPIRKPLALFNDDVGNPSTKQITP